MSPNASPVTVRGSGANSRTSSRSTAFSSFWYPRGRTPREPDIRRFDCVHREVDVRPYVLALRQLDEPGETGDLGHEENTARTEVVGV